MAVYTCTMNLAIDLFIETERLEPFTVNRSEDDEIQANGKGVNVSLILKMLGIDNTALGFQAGFTGHFIEEYVREQGISTDFIEVPGKTRINVFTQVNQTGKEYKLVNKGPMIPTEKVQELLIQISNFEQGDYLFVSGSLPQGMSAEILVEISRICYEKGVHLILDTSERTVLQCLRYQPFLLKPNEEELASWFQVSLDAKEDYISYGQQLLTMGAKNVLISLGGEGGIFMNNENILIGNSPRGKVVNTACAGDTLLGTFVAGYLKKQPLKEALKKSLAAGSSTAFRKGLTDFSDVESLSKDIHIKEGALNHGKI